MMKPHQLSHPTRLVCHDHLKCKPILARNEKIQQDRPFKNLFAPLPNPQKPILLIPTFRLPAHFKIRPGFIHLLPAFPLLDHPLQLWESLKRNRHRKVQFQLIQHRHDLVTNKTTVHPDLDPHSRQGPPQDLDTTRYKLPRPFRILDVPGTMVHNKGLSRLRNHTKQRIVTPRPLLFLIIPNRRSFDSLPFFPTDRPIKVQCQSNKGNLLKLNNHPFPTQPSYLYDTLLVQTGQAPGNGNHIRNPVEPKQLHHHKVIPIIVDVSKPAKAHQKINNQNQHNEVMSKDRGNL